MKSKNLFLQPVKTMVLVAVFLAGITGCQDDSSLISDNGNDDSALISSIQSASKESITFDALPAVTKTTLTNDYSESSVENVSMARSLGYQVSVIRDEGSFIGERNTLYFGQDGRQLQTVGNGRKGPGGEKPGKGGRDMKECFTFVLPVSFIMPDGSLITVTIKEEFILIKEWYATNPDITERPDLQFPVTVVLRDSTTMTISTEAELDSLRGTCLPPPPPVGGNKGGHGKGGDKGPHPVKLVFPVTYVMPDSSVITVQDEAGYEEIENWYELNPTVQERPLLQFPVTVILKDGTTRVINTQDEFDTLKKGKR